MSYHAIENLVEDTIQLIEISDLPMDQQRHLIYNLFSFQNRFDTSYTTLRCFSFLEKISYIKKLPINRHPDFKNSPAYFEVIKNSWIPADINHTGEVDVVYYQDGFIFPEYGSDIWKRLSEDGQWEEAKDLPIRISLVRLIIKGIELAIKVGKKTLMHNFYLAFLNSYLDDEISPEDGIPNDFESWIMDKDLLRLREHFIQNKLLMVKKKETDFDIPSRTFELNSDTEPEKRAKIEFLMDPKKQLDQINNSYLKAKRVLLELPAKIITIEDYLRDQMEKEGWNQVNVLKRDDSKEITWIWFKDVKKKASFRIFTAITLVLELKSIYAKQFVQHELLLDWQNKTFNTDIKDAHFELNPFEFIHDDNLEKKLNYFGLWVLPLGSKQTALSKSIAQFKEYLTPIDQIILDKINQEFPEKFFNRSFNSYVKIFDSDTQIDDFLLINNLYSIALLFIHNLLREGKVNDALKINDILESRLTDRFRENITWYKRSYLPYILQIKKGEKPKLAAFFLKN